MKIITQQMFSIYMYSSINVIYTWHGISNFKIIGLLHLVICEIRLHVACCLNALFPISLLIGV